MLPERLGEVVGDKAPNRTKAIAYNWSLVPELDSSFEASFFLTGRVYGGCIEIRRSAGSALLINAGSPIGVNLL